MTEQKLIPYDVSFDFEGGYNIRATQLLLRVIFDVAPENLAIEPSNLEMNRPMSETLFHATIAHLLSDEIKITIEKMQKGMPYLRDIKSHRSDENPSLSSSLQAA